MAGFYGGGRHHYLNTIDEEDYGGYGSQGGHGRYDAQGDYGDPGQSWFYGARRPRQNGSFVARSTRWGSMRPGAYSMGRYGNRIRGAPPRYGYF